MFVLLGLGMQHVLDATIVGSFPFYDSSSSAGPPKIRHFDHQNSEHSTAWKNAWNLEKDFLPSDESVKSVITDSALQKVALNTVRKLRDDQLNIQETIELIKQPEWQKVMEIVRGMPLKLFQQQTDHALAYFAASYIRTNPTTGKTKIMADKSFKLASSELLNLCTTPK